MYESMNLQAVKSCSCWNSAGESFPLCAIPSPQLSTGCSSSSPPCARVTSPPRDQGQHLDEVDKHRSVSLHRFIFYQFSPPWVYLYILFCRQSQPWAYIFLFSLFTTQGPLSVRQVPTLCYSTLSKQLKCLLKRGKIFRSYYHIFIDILIRFFKMASTMDMI